MFSFHLEEKYFLTWIESNNFRLMETFEGTRGKSEIYSIFFILKYYVSIIKLLRFCCRVVFWFSTFRMKIVHALHLNKYFLIKRFQWQIWKYSIISLSFNAWSDSSRLQMYLTSELQYKMDIPFTNNSNQLWNPNLMSVSFLLPITSFIQLHYLKNNFMIVVE